MRAIGCAREAVTIGLVCVAVTARAEIPRDAPSEVDVDRSDTPPGRSEFGFDGGAPVGEWGGSISIGWLERPIRFTDVDHGATFPVRRRQTVVIGGAIAIGSAAAIDARISGAHQIGDRLRGTGDDQPLDRWVAGDLVVGARIRVAGDDANAALVRGTLTLPTGSQHDFAGESSWALAWHLIGRWTLAGDVVAAATLGFRVRGREVAIFDRLVGDEFVGALGVAIPVRVLPGLRATGELVGVLGDRVVRERGPSPLEARGGAVITVGRLAFAARVGVGLVDEIGSPAWRATIEATLAGR